MPYPWIIISFIENQYIIFCHVYRALPIICLLEKMVVQITSLEFLMRYDMKKKSYLFLYLNLTSQSIEQWRKKLSLLFKIFDELDEFVAEWLGVELGIVRSWVRSTLWGFRWWRLLITAYSIGPFVGISQERQDPRWQPVLISRGYLG